MTRQRVLYIGRAAATALIVGLLVRVVGWGEIARVMGQTRLQWVPFVYLAALGALLTGSCVLRFLLHRVGLDVPLSRVVLANSLATFYGLLVPSDVFAGVAKWADLSTATGDKSRVLSAMVFAKVGLALPPLLIGSVALALDNPFSAAGLPAISAALSAALLLGTFLVLNRGTGSRLDAVAGGVMDRLPKWFRTRGRKLIEAGAGFRSLSLADLIGVLLLSTLGFGLGIAGMGFAVAAAGASVPLTVLPWVGMTLFLVRLVPITISNLGVREGIFMAAFGLYGIGSATAVAAGLIMFSGTLVIALIGGTYQLAIAGGWVRWRREHGR